MNKIENDFIQNEKAAQRHGITLLPRLNAIDFVKQCEQHSIKILGIDGFSFKGKTIQPGLENSIDFTSESQLMRSETYRESIEFVAKREDDLFYKVVCDA